MTIDTLKMHCKPRLYTVDQVEDQVREVDAFHALPLPPTTPLGKNKIEKGYYDGILFDSSWEAIVYIYFKYIECTSIERNKTEHLSYYDDNGRMRKFYPDFVVQGNHYVEVKGRYRPNDICKMHQCPTVTFIDAESIKPYQVAVNARFPNWKKQFLKKID